MGAPLAVQCRDLSKSYRTENVPVRALNGVFFDVPQGAFVMLAGPSGCGKTTLISIIAGILSHDEGDCLTFGQNMKAMGEAERLRFRARSIGFVFQQYNLIPTLTVAENVSVPLIVNGVPLKKALREAGLLLEKVGLGDRAESLPRQLSGGQQQRVAIARAIIHRPQLVVCDEPTSALDGENGRKVMGVLKGLAGAAGTTLIVVTHDSRIFEFADQIVHMEDGYVQKIV